MSFHWAGTEGNTNTRLTLGGGGGGGGVYCIAQIVCTGHGFWSHLVPSPLDKMLS